MTYANFSKGISSAYVPSVAPENLRPNSVINHLVKRMQPLSKGYIDKEGNYFRFWLWKSIVLGTLTKADGTELIIPAHKIINPCSNNKLCSSLTLEKLKNSNLDIVYNSDTGDESPAEWNEAIYRSMKIPKEKQRNLKLTLEEIFPCAIEFCKHHNERYENELAYVVQLIESMKKNPEMYPDEWKCWDKAIKDTVEKYMNYDGFDWSAELPTWPDKKSNPIV